MSAIQALNAIKMNIVARNGKKGRAYRSPTTPATKPYNASMSISRTL